MSQWNVQGVDRFTGNLVGVYLASPDAKSMKRADLNRAVRTAHDRAIKKFAAQGLVSVRVESVRCVG